MYKTKILFQSYIFTLVIMLSGCASVLGVTSVTELEKVDNPAGTGTEAVVGKTVDVHYTGWVYDANKVDHKGAKFDSSFDRGKPFSFKLGAGKVIKGWDQGVEGMKIGGKRTLVIPSELAYGSRGAGGVIPPDAALIFDVELINVQ